MTPINSTLLNLIINETQTEDICKKLNITKKQLKNRIEIIRNEGYNIRRKFNYDGSQKYFLDYNSQSIGNNLITNIDGFNKNEFKTLAIADTHFGNEKSNMYYVELIYDYCIKNNINIVLHLGDILQGNKENIMSLEEQIEYLINEYPNIPNIITFLQLGNHDEDITKVLGLNIKKIIENNRDDIVPLGYNMNQLKIGKNNIYLSHENKFTSSSGLRIAGHSHKYKFNSHQEVPTIIVPTLSDYSIINDYPGAIEINIKLEEQKFIYMILKHLIINESYKIKEVSTINYSFQKK